jgi:hypothetical protein
MERISILFKEYDSQGFHRTGTETDTQSAFWLADRVQNTGQVPHMIRFPHKRIDTINGILYIGDVRVSGVPCFDGTFTDSRGIQGRLGTLDGNNAIAVVDSWSLGARASYSARSGNRFKGIVIISDASAAGIRPGLVLSNAERFDSPFGPPVLQVSSEDKKLIFKAIQDAKPVRLAAEVKKTSVEAINVEVHIKGTQPNLAPVVVMTPRSGWWHCASERGGGIACWLEMIRALSESRPKRTVIFIASSGHELGHLGLEVFLDHNRDLVKRARLWIHLGANFAAIQPSQVRIQASDKDIEDSTLDAMARTGIQPDIRMPVGSRPLGEARNIHDGQGRYISLLGNNPYFHHIDDRWPHAVNLKKAQRLIDAFTQILLHYAS